MVDIKLNVYKSGNAEIGDLFDLLLTWTVFTLTRLQGFKNFKHFNWQQF